MFKRLISTLFVFVLLFESSACQVDRNDDVGVDFTENTPQTEYEQIDIPFQARYIQTDEGNLDWSRKPYAKVIRSVDDMKEYLELSQLKHCREDNMTHWADFWLACEKYNREFFETKYLIFISFEEGSSSTKHEVSAVTIDCNGQMKILIDAISIGFCVDVEAKWHVVLELEQRKETGDAKIIVEKRDFVYF